MLCCLVSVPRPETSVLFTVSLVPYFSHFCAFFIGNFAVSSGLEMQGRSACSVSKHGKAVLGLMEKIRVLDKLPAA